MERAALAAFLLALALGCAAALAADAVDLTQPVANGAQISGSKERKDHTAPTAQDAPGLKKTLAGPTLESEQGLPARPASPGTASLLRLGLGLVVVLALLFGLMVLLRRMGYGQGRGSGAIEILASRSLGPRERVVLIRSGERHLLLGVAPGRVAPLDQWVSTFQEFDQ
jgi:flagellar biosynthetic protein FliO